MPAGRPTKLTFPQKCYINLVCADGYLEQVPEYKNATWGKLLWVLVPIIGPLIFYLDVKDM